MKENNLWLSADELQHLLQGSLQWIDVEPRINAPRTGTRKLSQDIKRKSPVFGPKEPKEPQGLKDLKELNEANEVKAVKAEREEVTLKKEATAYKPLEGTPVVLLLGTVGLLTFSSWFYFLLFA